MFCFDDASLELLVSVTAIAAEKGLLATFQVRISWKKRDDVPGHFAHNRTKQILLFVINQ